MKHNQAKASVYQLKVTLDGIEPPIWRRLLVPSNITLDQFHGVIQVAMGWTNSHLHQFIVGKKYYGMLNNDEMDDELETIDERLYTLAQIATHKGALVVYQYDFGDNWEHLIIVEEILPAEKKSQPRCLDGARACPPEDVGSTCGYEDFLKAIKNPKHKEHKAMLDWAGGKFDPEALSVEAVNRTLKELQKAGSLEELWPCEEEELI